MKLPILFSRTSTGAVQQWQIVVEGNTFFTIEGQKDGKLTTATPTICEGKNSGKANKTSGEEQASKEAKSKWQKKIDSGYFEDIANIDNETFYEPMLAHKYGDHDVAFPCYSQPKLDGCLSGDVIVTLKNSGNKTIKEIFDEQIEDDILSYNEKKSRSEYKKIIGSYKNGKDIKENSHKWFELELSNNEKIKVTGNHLVYLPKLKCWRRVDELDINDEILFKE